MAGDYRRHNYGNGGVYTVDEGVHGDAAITYAEMHVLKLCLASSLSRSGYCGLVPLLRLVSRSQTVIFCFILGRETQYKKEKIIAV